jgi:hypothetical protein
VRLLFIPAPGPAPLLGAGGGFPPISPRPLGVLAGALRHIPLALFWGGCFSPGDGHTSPRGKGESGLCRKTAEKI